jgi:hypothetical protein
LCVGLQRLQEILRVPVPDKVKHWKKRAFDRIGNVSQTYKKIMKKIARINSTPQVIRACICIIRSILQVTQRVQPTCIITTDFTYAQSWLWPPVSSELLVQWSKTPSHSIMELAGPAMPL